MVLLHQFLQVSSTTIYSLIHRASSEYLAARTTSCATSPRRKHQRLGLRAQEPEEHGPRTKMVSYADYEWLIWIDTSDFEKIMSGKYWWLWMMIDYEWLWLIIDYDWWLWFTIDDYDWFCLILCDIDEYHIMVQYQIMCIDMTRFDAHLGIWDGIQCIDMSGTLPDGERYLQAPWNQPVVVYRKETQTPNARISKIRNYPWLELHEHIIGLQEKMPRNHCKWWLN